MSDNIWVSYRHPDGRTFTIGGNTPDAFFDNAAGMLGDGQAAQRLAEDFQVLANPSVAPAVAAAAPLRTPSPAPAANTPPPAPGAPTCIHGARTFRSSKPGASKQWTAWFCPQPKGADQCEAIWG